ncbi:MAG: ribonuclease [Actinomycetota bacterium]|nr:ribonuclease [Actinomycetota bacterium]
MPSEPDGIYKLALTHRSYANEKGLSEHNERLEFLGDAVLGAIVADLVYTRYGDLTEGEMTRMRISVVNTQALADLARDLGVGERIRLGKGEQSSGGQDKPSLLADTFEALVGAIYLERGMEGLRERLDPILEERLDAVMASSVPNDTKTLLQEFVMRETSELPAYRIAASGPDHDRRYTAHVFVGDEIYGSGSGRSKKEAEQNAAREALGRFEARRSDARAS